MACRILCQRYGSYIRVPGARLTTVVRHFSSYDESHSTDGEAFNIDLNSTDASFRWPETRLGPLEPKDHRFPLPGMVGSSATHTATVSPSRSMKIPQRPQYDADVLVAELPYERQSTAFEQFVAINTELMSKTSSIADSQTKSSPFDRLECVAHSCPLLLRNDFLELFPNSNLRRFDSLTVITLCRRTTMEKNSEQATDEGILVDFVSAATDVCEMLHGAGFWADFLDPASGRPYLGYRTNAVSFEVDDRYRRFGFEIEDTPGRCRILRHHALGSRPFVGCIFTTAPVTHPLIASLALDQPPTSLTSDGDGDGGQQ